jgi:alpha-N-arabinofuranosidase
LLICSGSNVKYGKLPGHDGNMIIEFENPRVPSGPVLTGWRPIGDVRLSLDSLHPLSDSLTTSLQLDIPKTAKGEIGFANDGIWPTTTSESLGSL